MEAVKSPDLTSVKVEFEKWRAARQGRERIPEQLWQSAVSLLANYSFNEVRKELHLNPRQFQKHAQVSAGSKLNYKSPRGRKAARQQDATPKPFLEVSPSLLAKTLPETSNNETASTTETTCRIIFERADGRFTLSKPPHSSNVGFTPN